MCPDWRLGDPTAWRSRWRSVRRPKQTRPAAPSELGVRHKLLVEISFADNKEVAGWVVACRGVANELGLSQLINVAVTVDTDVVGDVDPALRVLVVPLMLAEASGRVSVIAEDHRRVVDRHAAEGVGLAAGAGRTCPQSNDQNLWMALGLVT